MSNGIQTNAMAEIALALAMGFFSIMVLAMVSMAAGSDTRKPLVKIAKFDKGVNVASAQKLKNSKNKFEKPSKMEIENFLIFFNGEFLNAKLNNVDPAEFAKNKDRIILAVSNRSNFLDVTAARQKVLAHNVIVIPLNQQWSNVLKEKYNGHL